MGGTPFNFKAVAVGNDVVLTWAKLQMGTATFIVRDGLPLDRVDLPTLTYTDLGAASTPHTYLAYEVYRSASVAYIPPPPSGVPGAITGVTDTESGSNVTLVWTNGTKTDGVSIYEDGQDMAHRVFSAGWPQPAPTTWTQLGASAGSHTYYICGYNGMGEGARTAHAVTVGGGGGGGPIGIIGAYQDSHPSGTDDSVNLAALQAHLNTFATGGKTVKLTAITTYGGADYTPLNGVTPPGGTYILLGLGIGDGSPYTPTGKTLFAQVQSMAAQYQGLFQRCVGLVGTGRLITRVGYEWNGNWSPTGAYPNSGVGNFVLYPPADAYAAIAYIAGIQKNVDPLSLTDFNLVGGGPDGLKDQWSQPAINRCPMGTMKLNNGTTVPVIDIISVDLGIQPGNSQYLYGHAVPWIQIAVANNKQWAVPEFNMVGAASNAADGVLGIDDCINLAEGKLVTTRQSGISPASYQAPYPAKYVAFFSSNDGGNTGDLIDSVNDPYSRELALLLQT